MGSEKPDLLAQAKREAEENLNPNADKAYIDELKEEILYQLQDDFESKIQNEWLQILSSKTRFMKPSLINW